MKHLTGEKKMINSAKNNNNKIGIKGQDTNSASKIEQTFRLMNALDEFNNSKTGGGRILAIVKGLMGK